jgi:acetyl esterase/lipase
VGDILERTAPPADHRIHYGAGEAQFGDLFLPPIRLGRSWPVVVFIHGGWWKAQYGLEYGGYLGEALKREDVAVWSIEYRRVGNGGGYPATFQDVAAAFDHLKVLGQSYPLDLNRVIVAGHSAGGHLAFWLAGRPHVAEDSPLFRPQPVVPVYGVVALAGAVDLRLTIDLAGWMTFAHDKQEVVNFMGGLPDEVPERYLSGNPGDLLPFGVPQWLVQGTEDDQIPPTLPERWADRGHRMGERVTLEMIPGADHLDIFDPASRYWPRVKAVLLAALR